MVVFFANGPGEKRLVPTQTKRKLYAEDASVIDH
jgi:hypothetical protein